MNLPEQLPAGAQHSENDFGSLGADGTMLTPQPYHWLPVGELHEGMALARPVTGVHGQWLTLRFAPGSVLSADAIGQLILNGVESVAVFHSGPVDDAAQASLRQEWAAQLQQVFGEVPTPSCQGLHAALLTFGDTLC